MSLLPYALARPFLFGLDPETAHELTMDMLARAAGHAAAMGLLQRAVVDDPIDWPGLTFPNRVGLAAGLDKNARCIDGLGAMGFGFVEVGTVTPQGPARQPQAAHVPPARRPTRSSTAWASTTTAWTPLWPTSSARSFRSRTGRMLLG
jgi:hypothetical protein